MAPDTFDVKIFRKDTKRPSELINHTWDEILEVLRDYSSTIKNPVLRVVITRYSLFDVPLTSEEIDKLV